MCVKLYVCVCVRVGVGVRAVRVSVCQCMRVRVPGKMVATRFATTFRHHLSNGKMVALECPPPPQRAAANHSHCYPLLRTCAFRRTACAEVCVCLRARCTFAGRGICKKRGKHVHASPMWSFSHSAFMSRGPTRHPTRHLSSAFAACCGPFENEV